MLSSLLMYLQRKFLEQIKHAVILHIVGVSHFLPVWNEWKWEFWMFLVEKFSWRSGKCSPYQWHWFLRKLGWKRTFCDLSITWDFLCKIGKKIGQKNCGKQMSSWWRSRSCLVFYWVWDNSHPVFSLKAKNYWNIHSIPRYPKPKFSHFLGRLLGTLEHRQSSN